MEPRELEDLLKKTGGKYKLVTLFQKRMRELQRGLPRLAGEEGDSLMNIVSREVFENKIDLAMGEEADQLRREMAQRDEEEERKSLKSPRQAPAQAPAAPAPAPLFSDSK